MNTKRQLRYLMRAGSLQTGFLPRRGGPVLS